MLSLHRTLWFDNDKDFSKLFFFLSFIFFLDLHNQPQIFIPSNVETVCKKTIVNNQFNAFACFILDLKRS